MGLNAREVPGGTASLFELLYLRRVPTALVVICRHGDWNLMTHHLLRISVAMGVYGNLLDAIAP